jgi:hypothetical protein
MRISNKEFRGVLVLFITRYAATPKRRSRVLDAEFVFGASEDTHIGLYSRSLEGGAEGALGTSLLGCGSDRARRITTTCPIVGRKVYHADSDL